MEEEEERKEVENIFSKDTGNHELVSGVQENVDPSPPETAGNIDGKADAGQSSVTLQATDSVPKVLDQETTGITDGKADTGRSSVTLQVTDPVHKVLDEDQFEQVNLKDQDKTVGASLGSHVESNRTSNSDNARQSYGGFGISSQALTSEFDSSMADELQDDQSAWSPRQDSQFGHSIYTSMSAGSFDSSYYGDAGYSPVGSPPKSRQKPIMPNVSPELLHLVDSAIMGKPESLDKLKNIVSGVESFGTGEEMESIAYLVVDSLIATMGGVESFEEDEDNNPPSVMLNSRAAIVAGELIPSLPGFGDSHAIMSPRTRMVRGLLAILRACTRNRAMCSMAGLLGVLLRTAEKIFMQDVNSTEQMRWDGTPLCYCIQHLAGHSLSVVDMHRWFQVITRTLTTIWATRLMLALEKAMGGKESRGPACTFEFDGESSGLLGPGESRWPFTNGYAFATWIYIESFADTLNAATAAAAIAAAAAAKSGKSSAMSAAAAASALAGEGTAHMPRLFSFLSADNQGLEAYFHAQFLVVECDSGKGKKSSLHFTHAFKPQCWYFIGLEHTCKQGILGKAESELRLYIDGSLYETRPFEFPRISKPLAFCCIGTNPPATMAGLQRRRRQCPLFAEMGPVYIFKEPIGPERMSRLAFRGGDALPSFGHGAGLPWLATNVEVQNMAEESSLLDAEIGGLIHLFYHPSLLSGRFCPDASPSGASGILRRPAEVLGQVHIATRMRPIAALWAFSYGGPMSLLPLAVSNVDKVTLEPQQGNPSLSLATTALAAPIFRIISTAIQYPWNNEELCRTRGPEVLSRILNYLLLTLSSLYAGKQHGVGDEELVASVLSLCQSQQKNYSLKVQLFSTLLLDLKVWSLCNYGIQKKLLSSLADMVFTESSVMRDANAIQMLLDSCRRCYWTIREKDSVNTFSPSLNEASRPVGEVNALVDELLVIIELLVVAAPPSLASDDVRCLLGFMVDCPQPNQVARVLHLIYRLVVQPNTSRAQTFAEAFIASGGIETLLVLLQREAKAGDYSVPESMTNNDEVLSVQPPEQDGSVGGVSEKNQDDELETSKEKENSRKLVTFQSPEGASSPVSVSPELNIARMTSASESTFIKNLGGIDLSISADNARNNVYNIDKSDDVVARIIGLLGALVASGYLKIGSTASSDMSNNIIGNTLHGGGSMFEDKVSLLLFSLQKAFQAAPNRLLTSNVYAALLGASINASSADEALNFYDSGHQFEHVQLLLVLLRSLPFAPKALQIRALQDLLFLACSQSENRSSLTNMEEWPEWILEVLISSYEMGASKHSDSARDIEDLVHNFLIIMLEHSMRQKDGWKVMDSGPSNPSQSNHGTTPTSTPASGSMVQHRLHSSQAPPDAAAAASGNSSSVQSKRKNHSIAWDHFTLMKNPDGTPLAKPRAKCNHCPQTYGCDTRLNGTSNMKNHLLFNCPNCPLRVPKKQKQLAQESFDKKGKLVAWSYDQDVCRLALARMVVRDELPFSFVDGPGFKYFISQVQPQFKMFSRRTVARDIWELYESENITIKNILATYGQRVSLTTDTWTSIQNINYMVLTAHFIDVDWVLHKRILNFCVIPNHMGKTIGQLVETCLIGWGIEKIFCIVVDNASPNQVALDYMKEKIGNWNELVLKGEFLHLRCCCHILNLVVKDGMAELDSSIESIRNCVKYIRSSPSRLEKFRKCATQEKVEHKGGIVPLDVCTRWNSTYLMLDIAIKYRKAFQRMEDEDPQFAAYFSEKAGPPIAEDWNQAERLVRFLKISYEATLDFSGTQVVTSNQPIQWMCTLVGELNKCIEGNDKLLSKIAKSMKEKFDKYWGRVENINKILLIAIVLDPRYKFLYLDFFFPKLKIDKKLVEVLVINVKSTLQELFNEYAANDPDAALASYNSTQPMSVSKGVTEEEDSHYATVNEFVKLRQAKDVVEIKTEVDKYMLEASEDPRNSNFQLLGWWKENAARFPILSQIAKDVFAVPASTVASESAFSLGSRILDPFRASLTPKMVEALVCTSD